MLKTDILSFAGADLKTLRLRNAWEQKLASGDVMGKQKSAFTPGTAGETEEDDSRMQQIRAKLQCGGKLTEQERKYLQEKDPAAYTKLLEEERDQKNYERMLRTCRTREEVQQFKLRRIGQSLDRLKKIERDSSLSQEEKLDAVGRELRNVNHAIKSTQEYLRGARLKDDSSDAYCTMEEKLRCLLKERLEEILEERAKRTNSSRFDTFRTSNEPEDDSAKRIKDLYLEVQGNWQQSTAKAGWTLRV